MGRKPKPFEEGMPARTLPGMKLLKSTSKNRIYNMSYNKGRTLIRPWGTIRQDGSMTPWRDQNGKYGTSWIVQDLVAMAWGIDMRFTAFLEVDDPDNWPGGSPLQLFLDDMKGHEDFQHKYKLFKRNKGTFAPLDNPKGVGLVKGLLLETQGKEFFDRPIWGAVLVLPPSAKDALDSLVSQLSPGNVQSGSTDDDPQGWNSQYLVGDPIGFRTGKVFEFNKESAFTGDDSKQINLDSEGSGGQRSSGSDIESYACRIWPDKQTLPLDPHKVARYDEPFEKSLRYMTGEEQINELIIPGFGRSGKEMVLYTFGGKDILPKSFEFGRTTVDMGRVEGLPKMDVPEEDNNMKASEEHMSELDALAQSMGGPNINLDVPDDYDGAVNMGDEVPFDGGRGQLEKAQEPAMAAADTAGDIRARLANAAGKKK